MPTIELTDEELQQLTLVLAQASGPGISWMMTNGLLTKVQAAAQRQQGNIQAAVAQAGLAAADGLDHEPIATPPAFTGKAGARR